MKRGFLFGLGTFLLLGVLGGLGEAFKGDYLIGAIVIALCAPLSVLAIRKANAAAPNKSRLHAIGGWPIGFGVINVVLLTIVLIASGSRAHAQSFGDERCKQSSYVAGEIDRIITATKQVADMIEAVSPQEADYIRAEARTAPDQNNRTRFSLVQAHRFYYPVMFHDAYNQLEDRLTAARDGKGAKMIARHLVEALYRVSEVQTAANDYVLFDGNRSPTILSNDNRQTVYFLMPAAKSRIASMLQCVISQL